MVHLYTKAEKHMKEKVIIAFPRPAQCPLLEFYSNEIPVFLQSSTNRLSLPKT